MQLRSLWASQVALVVKNLAASAGDVGDSGLIPGSGTSPGGGQGNPLQYSCLENPMDRRVWSTMVHRVAKSWTGLKRLSKHTHIMTCVHHCNIIRSSLAAVTRLKQLSMQACMQKFSVLCLVISPFPTITPGNHGS